MVSSEKQTINFFDHLDRVHGQITNREALIFLDYDGTLTPIVATPDLAVISEEMRQAVQRLSEAYKVSVVSGRASDDVRGKMRIKDIFYAGSHGFEIVEPDGRVEVNREARQMRHLIDEVYAKLSERLKNIPGALVEHVKYTISTHYRLVSDEDFPEVEEAVDEALQEYPQFRKTRGKKVFEIRPGIDWHKGKAVEWILNVLEFDADKNAAVYIGDDTTDEDAFAAVEDKGFGILVADPPRPSRARYRIKDTREVKEVLEFFIRVNQEKNRT